MFTRNFVNKLFYPNLNALHFHYKYHYKFQIISRNVHTKYLDSQIEKIDFSQLNPDNFGDFNEKYGIKQNSPLKSEMIPEDPDEYDKLEIKRGIKISLGGYERILSEIYTQKPRNLNKLLETYHEMVYVNRYRPDTHIFTMLINACAEIGYTKKAIELYEEMKRFNLRPTKAAITALFNSCANCSLDKKYALEKILHLRKKLELDGFHFNMIHYNALVKAFGILGDMKNVKITIEEMKQKGFEMDLNTYSMLMMSCISDQSNGLYLATYAMKKILKSNLTLHVNIFNLFLRCIRDCQIQTKEKIIRLCQQKTNDQSEKQVSLIKCSENKNNLPNLLTGFNVDHILSIDFNSLSLAKNRFLLFGGIDGICNIMDSRGIKPNLKTLTIIIDLLDDENCLEEIKNLLSRYNIKPDVFLYNVLIKKFSKNKKHSLCQEMIQEMQKNHIRPDIMTFGALAFSCHELEAAKQFLGDMYKCNIRPNNEIMGNLINNACKDKNLHYIKFLLYYIRTNGLSLSIMDIERIELALSRIRQKFINIERSNQLENNSKKLPIRLFYEVSADFKQLLKKTNVKINLNVWSQFEQNDYPNQKAKYNSVVTYMKKKIDTKMQKDTNEIIFDYDEIDD